MNKIFSLGFCLFLAGCATAPAVPRFTENDAGKTVAVQKGARFEVELVSNPSTGFGWEVLPTQCKIERRDFRIPEERRGLCGAAGTETFLVRADFSGQSELKFVYRRVWEKVPPERTFSLTVRTTE
ncbi:MAG: protease inhibitor I42 family protein [Victivallaceae bacterium]|nr:protease inhibitor I42 family protein [Victivallaceae bacterium]